MGIEDERGEKGNKPGGETESKVWVSSCRMPTTSLAEFSFSTVFHNFVYLLQTPSIPKEIRYGQNCQAVAVHLTGHSGLERHIPVGIDRFLQDIPG